jgi:hypothetical protein
MAVHQGLLVFNIELIDRAETLTAHAGLPVVVETALAALPTAAYRALRDALGYSSWKVVRRHLLSLVTVVTAGGEHLSDLETLRADLGLSAMLGFTLSSPTQAKDFLYRFHQAEDGRLLLEEDDDVLRFDTSAPMTPKRPLPMPQEAAPKPSRAPLPLTARPEQPPCRKGLDDYGLACRLDLRLRTV